MSVCCIASNKVDDINSSQIHDSLAARDELAKFKHNSVQDIHLLPPGVLLPASEVDERIHLFFIRLAVAALHLTSLRISSCNTRKVVAIQPASDSW